MTRIWSGFKKLSTAQRGEPRTAAPGAVTSELDSVALPVPRGARVTPAWELPKPRRPLPAAAAPASHTLTELPPELFMLILQKLPPRGLFGLAATCRDLRLKSRDPALWTSERLANASSFSLGTLPVDVQDLPAVRAARFHALAARAISSQESSLLLTLYKRPFAGLAALDSAARAQVERAYDALARKHFDSQWCDALVQELCFPHVEIRRRATALYLAGSAPAQRVFADDATCLSLASKFLDGPTHPNHATGPGQHRFYAESLAPIQAVAKQLDRSPDHGLARQTFVGAIPGSALSTDPALQQQANALRVAHPWLQLAWTQERTLTMFEFTAP